jgi:hypothetical protein
VILTILSRFQLSCSSAITWQFHSNVIISSMALTLIDHHVHHSLGHHFPSRVQRLFRMYLRSLQRRVQSLARTRYSQARCCAQLIKNKAMCDTSEGSSVDVLLKEANLECSIFTMARLYQVSLVGFGLGFVKRRCGGSGLAAALASRMTAAGTASRKSCSLSVNFLVNVIMNRVLGGRLSESIARSVRGELSRSIYRRPMCKYMSALQVMRSRGRLPVADNLVLQAEVRRCISCDQSSLASEQQARSGEFAADTVKARICTAAEDLHVDVVELLSIADPRSVLARDRSSLPLPSFCVQLAPRSTMTP